MDIFEDDTGPGPDNRPEFTVSEIAGAVKRVVEGEFGRVRVRGEIGRVSRPASGHVYFNLKDDRASLDAVIWRGQAARMVVKPEEGLEVVATGRMTTFPGASKYQLIVEDMAPAGEGALMAMLEARRKALAAEGLFDAARKRPLPYLPGVIGVITSPSGAVIRDILHRLRDRFPRKVLVWPVAVQGQACAPEVARAIAGFNALSVGGAIPRPDVLIVARGGGSLEDLWGFNEEIVVRAAAASQIPLISAVGHETDTTLIDHAADLRAPTPTAAAELAVPVRAELLAQVAQLGGRLTSGVVQGAQRRRQRLSDLSRALPRPERLTESAAQRLDQVSARLGNALATGQQTRRLQLARITLQPAALRQRLRGEGRALMALGARLTPALTRRTGDLRKRLDASARLLQTLSYAETLARGFAVVRAGEAVITRAADVVPVMEIEFADGRVPVHSTRAPRPRKRDPDPPEQGSLL